MKFSKLKYIICLSVLWLCIFKVNAQAPAPDQKTTIRGIVVDIDKVPLAGVHVYIQESRNDVGVTTKADGAFEFKCTTSDVLVFKKEGYLLVIKGIPEIRDGKVTLIKALIDAGDDDDVYIPFGVRKKRQVTATISNIKGDDLPQIPSSALTNVFTGRLSGLLITPNGSQQPGYDVSSFLVRGRSSYNSNQPPLILVDGAERDFNTMDVKEIESVSVFKDAATLAWYGMYAGNGIVYIKTKRGSATSTKVTFDAQGGISTPLEVAKSLDSYTYASLFNEAQINSGITPTFTATQLAAYQNPNSDPYLYPNNHYTQDFLKKTAPTQRYVTTVSGGNAFIKFYTLLSYYDQGGYYKGGYNSRYDANTDFNRINLRSNLDLHINKNLDIALNIGGRITNLRFPGAGSVTFLNTLYTLPPNAFPLVNADGTYGGTANFQQNNPLAMMSASGAYTDLTKNMIADVSAKQKMDGVLQGLSASLYYSYDVYGSYRSGFTQSYQTVDPNAAGGRITYGSNGLVNYFTNTFTGNVKKTELWAGLDYDHNFGKHGIQFSTRASEAVYATFIALDTRRDGWSNRLSYNYNQRYFVDLIGTFSGSENFMPGKRVGFFPAASAGWIISDEKFMKGVKFLDYLKFRGSYGVVGNDALGTSRRFAFLNNYTSSGNSYNFGTSYTTANGSAENPLGNPDLTWEKAYKTSVGFDAKLFKQALSITADYFYEDRKDLLTTSLLPDVIGQTLTSVNQGEAAYKGIEANFDINKTIGKVNVKLFGNFTYNTSKILAINEGAGLPAYQKQLGHPISSVVQNTTSGTSYSHLFLLSDGIFQNQAQIDAAPIQRFSRTTKPGDIKYKDVNGDGVVDNLDFVHLENNFIPKSYFGFGTKVTLVNFDLSVFFQGTLGRTITIQNVINSGSNANGYLNQFSVDRWTPTTPNADYPRLVVADRGNNTQLSDFWFKSGDYLRLKNIEWGYTVPSNLVKRLRLTELRLYVSALNLVTFDKLGSLPIDPELPESGYNSAYPYPYSKIYAFGLNLKF
jgi:TonB-linked SusC/RagA family outer membrane protein